MLFAGISKGGFGSGAAFAATPLMALIIAPAEAVALMLPLLMIMDATALRAWWGKWSEVEARHLILGSVAGVVAGVALFRYLDADVIRIMIGLIALGFVAFQLLQSRGFLRLDDRETGRADGLMWGAVGGFTSFVSHAGGPPAAVYLLGRKLEKQAYQGTTVIVFAAINGMKLVAYTWLGMFGGGTLLGVIALAPFAVLGVWLGVRAHSLITNAQFFAVTYVLLTVTGLRLIWVALT